MNKSIPISSSKSSWWSKRVYKINAFLCLLQNIKISNSTLSREPHRLLSFHFSYERWDQHCFQQRHGDINKFAFPCVTAYAVTAAHLFCVTLCNKLDLTSFFLHYKVQMSSGNRISRAALNERNKQFYCLLIREIPNLFLSCHWFSMSYFTIFLLLKWINNQFGCNLWISVLLLLASSKY